MKQLLALLLLATCAATAQGQIIKSLGYNTTNGQVVYTGTNVMTFTNTVFFGDDISIDNAVIKFGGNEVINLEERVLFGDFTIAGDLGFQNNTNAATTRTNLGLGLPALTNTNTANFYEALGFNLGTELGTPAAAELFDISNGETAFAINDSEVFIIGGVVANFRSSLGLGATNNVTFSNITANGTLGVTGSATFSTNVTVTGNATLNGVANLAPAQTASSASSLMTRGLLPAATGHESSFGPAFNFNTAAANGGSAAVVRVSGIDVRKGNNANGGGCVAFGESFWTLGSFTGANMPASKAIDFYMHGVTFLVTTNTNWVSRIIFGQGTAARVPPAAGEPAVSTKSWGVEFFYNGTDQVFRPFYHDGTNLVTASEQTMPGSGNPFVGAVKMSQSGTGGLSVTFAPTTSARIPDTPTFVTNVPSMATGTYAGRYILVEAAGNTNVLASSTGFITRAQYIHYVP